MSIQLPDGTRLYYPVVPDRQKQYVHPSSPIPLPYSFIPYVRVCHRCEAPVLVGYNATRGQQMALDPFPWTTGHETGDAHLPGMTIDEHNPVIGLGQYHTKDHPLSKHNNEAFLLRPHTCSMKAIDSQIEHLLAKIWELKGLYSGKIEDPYLQRVLDISEQKKVDSHS